MTSINEMHVAIVTYFAAEKRSSLLFMAAGIVAISFSVFLWRTSWRGVVYPLAAIGIIQIVVGSTVYFRTDAQVLELHKKLAADPATYLAVEQPRMEKVQRSFVVYKVLEAVLLAAGILGAFIFRERQALYAASVGLITQTALMLVLEIFAERRGEVYIEQIRRLAG